MRFLLLCLMVTVLISQHRPADPAEPAKVEPQPRRYAAALRIMMDGDKINRAGINRFDVAEAFNNFLDSHAKFKLSELQAVKVAAGPDKEVPLRELVMIDVELEAPAVKGKK